MTATLTIDRIVATSPDDGLGWAGRVDESCMAWRTPGLSGP